MSLNLELQLLCVFLFGAFLWFLREPLNKSVFMAGKTEQDRVGSFFPFSGSKNLGFGSWITGNCFFCVGFPTLRTDCSRHASNSFHLR
jgi:hypothetical protein